MNNAEQVECCALAGIVMAAGYLRETRRQSPTLGQDSTCLCMVHAKLIALKVEKIEAARRGISDYLFILRWIRYKQAQPADVVHDACRKRNVSVFPTGLRDQVRQDGGCHSMLPATAQFFGPQSSFCVGSSGVRQDEFPGKVDPQQVHCL
jgi:hypothetical protein